ncbi:MAG: general secretion pathway protein GspB [Methylococcales bacterium]|nr:general secretion pathway protein GspB [Methylococcales bacterium]
MSFILNALRKSEQERQALQPETVTDRILLPQPQQNRGKTAKFFAFLIIGNMLIIACVVWFVRNNSTPAPDPTAQTILKPVPAQDTAVKSEAIAKLIQPEKPAQKAESKTTSIAKLIEAQKPEPVRSPVKPVITKKTATDTIKQPAIINKYELPVQTLPAIAAIDKVEPNPPEAIPVKKDIPFLSDLPFEFRHTVPKFTTNVFVYSNHPEESFVMIDMVKYKPGQQIKEAMVLKEIRPNSLVVVYQNQAFQIERP